MDGFLRKITGAPILGSSSDTNNNDLEASSSSSSTNLVPFVFRRETLEVIDVVHLEVQTLELPPEHFVSLTVADCQFEDDDALLEFENFLQRTSILHSLSLTDCSIGNSCLAKLLKAATTTTRTGNNNSNETSSNRKTHVLEHVEVTVAADARLKKVVEACATLPSLELCGDSEENYLEAEFVDDVVDAWDNRKAGEHLQTLSLSQMELSEEALGALVDHGLPRLSRLQTLKLDIVGGLASSSEGLGPLTRLLERTHPASPEQPPSLTSLELEVSHCPELMAYADESTMTPFLTALRKTHGLVELSLDEVGMSSGQLGQVLTALQSHPRLSYLALAGRDLLDTAERSSRSHWKRWIAALQRLSAVTFVSIRDPSVAAESSADDEATNNTSAASLLQQDWLPLQLVALLFQSSHNNNNNNSIDKNKTALKALFVAAGRAEFVCKAEDAPQRLGQALAAYATNHTSSLSSSAFPAETTPRSVSTTTTTTSPSSPSREEPHFPRGLWAPALATLGRCNRTAFFEGLRHGSDSWLLSLAPTAVET